MGKSAVSSHAIGAEICRALGLEDRMVVGLSIHLRGGEVATVTVKECLLAEQVQPLREVLARYQLVEREEMSSTQIVPDEPVLPITGRNAVAPAPDARSDVPTGAGRAD